MKIIMVSRETIQYYIGFDLSSIFYIHLINFTSEEPDNQWTIFCKIFIFQILTKRGLMYRTCSLMWFKISAYSPFYKNVVLTLEKINFVNQNILFPLLKYELSKEPIDGTYCVPSMSGLAELNELLHFYISITCI